MARLTFALQWIAVAGALAFLAFTTTVAFGEVWGSVWALWLLLGVSSWLVAALPMLRLRSAPSGLMLAYGSTFFLLWLSTERVSSPRSEPHKVVSLAFLVLPVLAAFGAIMAVLWIANAAPKAKVAAWRLLALLVLSLAIAYFSGGAGSAGRMIPFLSNLLHISMEVAGTLAFWMRKSVHVLFYGTLAWLALRASWSGGLVRSAAIAWAVLWCVSHAGFDEFRQAASSTRTGTPWDVVLDAAGVALALRLTARRATSSKPAVASSDP